jgi:2Fe-2S ferredoxin
LPAVTFLLPGGVRRTHDAAEGSSLLEASRRLGLAIEGACGGEMACATCHVHVADDWYDRLDPPSAEEEDLLDLAPSLCATSRLACQIRLSARHDGLIVAVPRSTLLA